MCVRRDEKRPRGAGNYSTRINSRAILRRSIRLYRIRGSAPTQRRELISAGPLDITRYIPRGIQRGHGRKERVGKRRRRFGPLYQIQVVIRVSKTLVRWERSLNYSFRSARLVTSIKCKAAFKGSVYSSSMKDS